MSSLLLTMWPNFEKQNGCRVFLFHFRIDELFVTGKDFYLKELLKES